MPRLRLALAQSNPVVGDLVGNADLIVEAVRRAKTAGAQLGATGEMALTGYPIEDLALQPSFLRASHGAVAALATRLQDEGLGDIPRAPVERALTTPRTTKETNRCPTPDRMR